MRPAIPAFLLFLSASAVAQTTVTTVAGTPGNAGLRDGSWSQALFSSPTALSIDNETRDLYVVDRGNVRVRRIGADGMVVTLAPSSNGFNFGAAGSGGVAPYGRLRPAFRDWGSVFVGNTARHAIERIQTEAVRIEAGEHDQAGSANGIYFLARFNSPTQMVFDSRGNLYVCDTGNHVIRVLLPIIGFVGDDGYLVQTFAGTSGVAGARDGDAEEASFNAPRGIGLDSLGTVYIADTGNHIIRAIEIVRDAFSRPLYGIVKTLAGRAGVAGWLDGSASEALFNAPMGVAVDATGIVYVADTGNSVIRAIFADGTVRTLAGVPTLPGHADGIAGQALFNRPVGIVVGSPGILYVADSANHVLRRIAVPAPPRRRTARK